MATAPQRPTNLESVIDCNRCVARRFGVTLRTYKTVKASAQLAGAAAGVYAMYLGADPLQALTIIGIILAGPEYLEYKIANEDSNSSDG